MLNKRSALPTTIPDPTTIPNPQHKADASHMLNTDTNPVTETNPQHNTDALHTLSTSTTSCTNDPPPPPSPDAITEAEAIADALHMLGSPNSPTLPVRPRNRRPPRVNIYEAFGPV
jgi:hypothetical protein